MLIYDDRKQCLNSDRLPNEIRNYKNAIIRDFAWAYLVDINSADLETVLLFLEKKLMRKD